MKEKVCTHCGHHKALSQFYRRDTGHPSSWCKDCVREAAAKKRREHPELVGYNPDVDIWTHRHRRYGLSRAQFEAMLDEQDGRCAICRDLPGDKGLCVDHDHKTNKVRGLLCNRCNWTLGHMRDNPDYLNNAITYLHHGFIG